MILTIEAATPGELKDKICAMAAVFGSGVASTQLELPLGESVAQTDAVATEPKRTRKPRAPKEEKATVSATQTQEPAETAQVAADQVFADDLVPTETVAEAATTAQPTPTPGKTPREQAVQALSALIDTKNGVSVAREVLKKFGCTRISEVKEQDCVKFAESCWAAMKAKAA